MKEEEKIEKRMHILRLPFHIIIDFPIAIVGVYFIHTIFHHSIAAVFSNTLRQQQHLQMQFMWFLFGVCVCVYKRERLFVWFTHENILYIWIKDTSEILLFARHASQSENEPKGKLIEIENEQIEK